jgi:succinate dehydrogenase flavin-adding protein (antitoxin of CptAB toxin-antitoxin module)
MGKILEFKKVTQKIKELQQIQTILEDVDDDISAIVNDHSLTPSNRRYLLENMLMDIDEKLEEYKRELDKAERKLEALVRASEKEIEAAYNEYIARVTSLTHSVNNITRKKLEGKN